MFFGIHAGYDFVASEDGLALSKERADLYRECAKRGISIIIMKAYNNGQLLDERLSSFKRTMAPWQCVQDALDRPTISSALTGTISAKENQAANAVIDR